MAQSGRRGIARIIKATQYSWQGLRAAWRHEAAFREEILASIVLIPLGLYLGDTAVERALLCGSVILVLIVELLNSAVEAAIDRQGDEIHELSGRAKDMGSAAVGLALLLGALVWGLILIPF